MNKIELLSPAGDMNKLKTAFASQVGGTLGNSLERAVAE